MKQSRENLDLPLQGTKAKVKYHVPLQGTNVNEGDTTATPLEPALSNAEGAAREDDLVGFALSISSSKNKNNRCFRLTQRSPTNVGWA